MICDTSTVRNEMLKEKIEKRESGIVLYGITPPKKETSPEKVAEISLRHIERIRNEGIDGLILYDLQDEQARTTEERPFPFMETLDALDYSETYLHELDVTKIVYRSVGKYTSQQLQDFLSRASQKKCLTVFVGAPSITQQVLLNLSDAYKLKNASGYDILMGGVTIPERHMEMADEHLRVFGKISEGCTFFVSQGVYDVNASKNFLSEYYYHGQKLGVPLAPIMFTLTPCGSAKTLQFMEWLGISIPHWLKNDLIHSQDILEKSVDFAERNWLELKHFADEKGIPIGCNIESVAIRKVEIEASIELLHRVKASLNR